MWRSMALLHILLLHKRNHFVSQPVFDIFLKGNFSGGVVTKMSFLVVSIGILMIV